MRAALRLRSLERIARCRVAVVPALDRAHRGPFGMTVAPRWRYGHGSVGVEGRCGCRVVGAYARARVVAARESALLWRTGGAGAGTAAAESDEGGDGCRRGGGAALDDAGA